MTIRISSRFDSPLFSILGTFPVMAAASASAIAQDRLPTVVVERDNVEISKSCIVEIRKSPIIDADGNGVIHVTADDVTIEFTDNQQMRELLGAPDDTLWDQLTGYGIVIEGHDNVTIRNAHLHRFKVGIYAKDCDGLTLDGCDVAGGFAQHLGSTPEREDSSDWLWPHRNENNEWMNNYGAGIYVEESDDVTIRKCFARRRQNGIVIDEVNQSRIYDNDCSFLSGWGLAMWKSSGNIISRNAFDFCIRGYSHGVYNRGQDSAGILMFEQNNDNILAENSATHGGDGIFGFGGREALGEIWMEKERQRLKKETGKDNVDDLIKFTPEILDQFRRRGNNNNLLVNNDFSYAAAHGIEMTFSFDNQFCDNRIVGNAICGVWGGYSQDTRIAGNLFEANGEYGYGLERGGVNIEHGRNNVIEWNTFRNNKCGVHLWWDPDEGLMNLPWARVNEKGSRDNSIINNRFIGDDIAVHLHETTDTVFVSNTMRNVGTEVKLGHGSPEDDHSNLIRDAMLPAVMYSTPDYTALGKSKPVGARLNLAGRENIIMTEWFPWDHESPLALRTGGTEAGSMQHEYTIFNADRIRSAIPANASTRLQRIFVGPYDRANHTQTVTVDCPNAPGVYSYAVAVDAGDYSPTLTGTFINADWEVKVFPWTIDPRDDLEGWYRESKSDKAMTAETKSLNLTYGGGGPSQVGLSDAITKAGFAPDHFGTIARTRLRLEAGKWKVTTVSDDGVRVTVDGDRVIDNWTWHGPTENSGEFTLNRPQTAEILVEHFEIDGYAILEFRIERAD